MREQDVQNSFRIYKSKQKVELWKNPSGAYYVDGRLIRYGLCNESAYANQCIKSADLIGGEMITITPEMVGQTVLKLVAYEVKKPNWKYRGTDHEIAQKVFIDKINSKGGDAAFVTINKEGEFVYVK